jgi:hypothetical protein
LQIRKAKKSHREKEMQKEMSIVSSVTKTAGKFKAGSKGVLGTSASGIGTDQLMRVVDNIFGAPVQRIFSVSVPVIGAVGPIDIMNYVVHSGKLGFSKNGLIAVVAAKAANGVLPQISGLSLPQANSQQTQNQTPSATGSGIGF